MLPHEKALSKAKIALMARTDSAFFTTLCFNLKHVFDDKVQTAETNGDTIFYSPAFFMSLTTGQQVFLLVHETMHVALMHMTRMAGKDRNKWNIAADHVINLMLKERKFDMPPSGLADPIYAGMNTEQVYALLPDNPEPPPMKDLVDPIGDLQKMEEVIQDKIVQAAIQSKAAGDKPGTIPGEIEIFLQKLLNPKLPWNAILRKYFQNLAKIDYSWMRPNRRFMPDYYMPSLQGRSLINIAVAVDTSGSVSDEEFQQMVSDVASILKMQKPEKITIIQFDTGIKSITEVKSLKELMNVKFTGRGGTDIAPVLEWVEKNKPQVALVFSDGYFSWPVGKTRGNYVWLTHNNKEFKAPFGKTIHYEITK